jgi:hypothetical protein
MTDCKQPSFWATFLSLGISAIFAIRKSRRAEAIEAADRKADQLKAAIASMRERNVSAQSVR